MKPLYFLSLLLLIASTFSCAPAYIPSKVNPGLFTEEGELHAEVATGTSGWDPQLAYAASDHLMFTANASFRNQPYETTVLQGNGSFEYSGRKKHQIAEVGVGVYEKAGGGLFELVGGYGRGQVFDMEVETLYFTTDEDDLLLESGDVGVLNARFNKWFIQPTVGYSSKGFDFGVTSRFSHVQMNIERERFKNWFWEPALTMRAGHQNVKFTSQLGFSVPFGHEIAYSWEPFIFSVGIMADLNVLGK